MKLKKNISIVIIVLVVNNIFAQNQIIGLKEAIKMAIANKSSIMALKADVSLDSLNAIQLLAQNKPQVSLAYDYLYNPVRRTSVVPVGRFSPVPTDEVRPIKFGTNFNQTVGAQITYPIYNATVKSKIAETNLQYRIKQAEINTANEELAYEVAQSFVKILLKQKQLQELAIDTLRTEQTLSFAKARFSEGKALKTEVNKAQLNHKAVVFSLEDIISTLVIEKIYLSFLIGLPDPSFEISDTDNLLNQQNLTWLSEPTNTAGLSKLNEYTGRIDLINQQIKNEKIKYQPTISANGYLAAEQYANQLNPFESNSWFGNSYLGVSIRMPILLGEDKKNKLSQYEAQKTAIAFQKEEVIKLADSNRQKALQEMNQLNKEYAFYSSNLILLKENLDLYKERLNEGQETITTVNLEEIEYQKEAEKLKTVDGKMWQYWLQYLKNAGLMARLY
jgi:outer membrane protein